VIAGIGEVRAGREDSHERYACEMNGHSYNPGVLMRAPDLKRDNDIVVKNIQVCDLYSGGSDPSRVAVGNCWFFVNLNCSDKQAFYSSNVATRINMSFTNTDHTLNFKILTFKAGMDLTPADFKKSEESLLENGHLPIVGLECYNRIPIENDYRSNIISSTKTLPSQVPCVCRTTGNHSRFKRYVFTFVA
jgi:hypothetical protein